MHHFSAERIVMPSLSVIIPTYCEAENLPELISRIDAAVREAGIETEILVVDDNSPDETPAVCAELAEQFPLRLIVRKTERGLASAVIAGMNAASGEVLLCMDADLSHPPEKVPELYAALQNGNDLDCPADFVMGSRYVNGGGTDEDWGLFRLLNSKVATWLARPLTRVSDPMAGFFAIKQSTFARAEPLDPVGFKIALELIVKCRCQHVAEVPIQFHDRKHGESKLSLKEQINYLRHLSRLYAHQWKTAASFVLFGCVGLTGFGIDVLLFLLLMQWVSVGIAAGVAIGGAMTWNYVLNRQVTFRNTPRKPWFAQYLLFCGSCLLGGVLNWMTRVGLVTGTVYFSAHPLQAAAVGVLAGMVSNFLLCRFFVFASPESIFGPRVAKTPAATNPIPQPERGVSV